MPRRKWVPVRMTHQRATGRGTVLPPCIGDQSCDGPCARRFCCSSQPSALPRTRSHSSPWPVRPWNRPRGMTTRLACSSTSGRPPGRTRSTTPGHAAREDQSREARHRPVGRGGRGDGGQVHRLRGQAHRRLLLVADRDDRLQREEHAVARRQGRRAHGPVAVLPAARHEAGRVPEPRGRQARGRGRRPVRHARRPGTVRQGLSPATHRGAHAATARCTRSGSTAA